MQKSCFANFSCVCRSFTDAMIETLLVYEMSEIKKKKCIEHYMRLN